MNTILLEPTDVLFFRDGRPMGGASSGHGAAWPLPSVVNHAFHAALHRAGFDGVHEHRRGRSGSYEEIRDRKFGSLQTAGPFPVQIHENGRTWFFPRPADADDTGAIVLQPFNGSTGASSLSAPCRYPVISNSPPSKEAPKQWWSETAWNDYLGSPHRSGASSDVTRRSDNEFSDIEHTYGIEISPHTGTVEEGQFYSAHYLRLRSDWRLGMFADARDKQFHHESFGDDLVRALLNGKGTEIITGGQQRVCTAALEASHSGRLPPPLGKSSGFVETGGKHLVKWVLLSPAIFPAIDKHPGGWLPTWIDHLTGNVQLLDGPGKNAARRRGEEPGQPIDATLVAAIVPKPISVTGWALPHSEAGREEGGAKSTHLAVPAGAVYYFEAASDDAARKLAAALNWHGANVASSVPLEEKVASSVSLEENVKASVPLAVPQQTNNSGQQTTTPAIRNRRSPLMGEKGFGLGVCGTWNFHPEGTPP